jgi:signal transduction histidine kinase
LGAVATFRDITEQKKAEAALRHANAELQASNEALDTYAHTVAHELKNTLARVVGYAELLEEARQTLSEAQVERALHLIARDSRQMTKTIDAMLLLAQVRKQEEITVTSLDMQSIVLRALDRLENLIEQRDARIELPDGWPQALGYAPWIEEVWMNYLSNAIKYGGTPPHVTVGGGIVDRCARFWVRDRGPGLSEEEQAALFTPFKRIYEGHIKGHGLGLSIVRRILNRLGGEVGVESATGEGSTFWFTLPTPPA